MKDKKRLIYIGIWIIFLIFIFSLNDIVLFNEPYKIKKTDFVTSDGTVKQNLDAVSNSDDIKQYIYMSGFAYINAEENTGNENRRVTLVFQSENNSYEVNTDLTERKDVFELSNKKMGNKLGYMTKFSPAKMKKGIYSLFVKVYENDEIQGVIETIHKFSKDSTGLHQYFTPKADKSILEKDMNYYGDFSERKLLRGGLNSIFYRSSYTDHLVLGGNFYYEGKDKSEYQLYVALKNSDGSSQIYETSFYEGFLFTSQIPFSEITDTTEATLILEIDDEYYIISSYSYKKMEDRNYKRIFDFPFSYSPLKEEQKEIIDYYKIPLTEDENALSLHTNNLEKIIDNGKEYVKVSGWAIDTHLNTTLKASYIKVGENYYKTNHYDIPDLIKNYGNQYLKAGFMAIIPIEEFEKANYEFSFLTVGHDGTYRFQERKASISIEK